MSNPSDLKFLVVDGEAGISSEEPCSTCDVMASRCGPELPDSTAKWWKYEAPC